MDIEKPQTVQVVTGVAAIHSYFHVATGVLIGSEAIVETGHYVTVPVEDAPGGVTEEWHLHKRDARPVEKADLARLLDHGVDVHTDLHAKTAHNAALVPENEAMVARLEELEPLVPALKEALQAANDETARLTKALSEAQSQRDALALQLAARRPAPEGARRTRAK